MGRKDTSLPFNDMLTSQDLTRCVGTGKNKSKNRKKKKTKNNMTKNQKNSKF